mgnify:CR=1 FL=1
MAELPLENLAELVSEGKVQILALPKLEVAITMSHKKLIRVLRFCPLSETFGQSSSELNEHILSKTKCSLTVCQLIR